MCSSRTSHYPQEIEGARVVVHGMNEAELRRNSQATECHVQDLNKDPMLPWAENTFEFVTHVVMHKHTCLSMSVTCQDACSLLWI